MEIIKLLIPFITFLLGIIAVPFIEDRKEDRKIKRIIHSIMIEIEEENDYIKQAIKVTESSIKIRLSKDVSQDFYCVPLPLNLMIMNDNIKTVYPLLTKGQRIAFKLLVEIEKKIKTIHHEIITSHFNNNQRCLELEREMLQLMLSGYYLMNELINQKANFTYPNWNIDPVAMAAKSLSVEIL